MKKLLLLTIILALPLLAQGQNVDTFLQRYKTFVTSTTKKKNLTEAEAAVADSTFDALTQEYHDTYKPLMNSDQIATYTEYRTRYVRRRFGRSTSKTADNVGEHIDTIGHKVVKGTKKVGAKVSGFVKGVFTNK